ncbi:hypothetical protein GCM10010531_33540 [Blastococcus jejuensis]|uniref:Copper(I)-binding protein n=1 Tax=Blastococcus jejuensis TaxID=351224 RepID=A0ABP6PFF7_9ACTN
MPPHRRLAALALVAALPLPACAGGDLTGPDDEGAVGPDETVSATVEVLQVQLEYPLDGRYDVGEDARLFLAVTNSGNDDDTLLDVTGPDFADAVLTVDGRAADIPVPADDNVYIGAEAEPSILLEDLARPLRSSQSIPVTLEFAEAGSVSLDAVVAAEGQSPAAPFDFPDPAEDPSPDS